MIIDSHVHISCLKKDETFLEAKNKLLLDMKSNNIDFAMVIPDNEPNSQCADLDTVRSLIKNEARLYMLGTLRVTDINKTTTTKINNFFSQETIKGFKIFPGHDPVYPTDKRWLPIYRLCIKHNLPLIIHTGANPGDIKCAKYNDPKHIVKIARDYPKLKIIISHYFWPELDYCFSITNGLNNIYFDTSALADPQVIKESGGIKKMKEILTKTVKRKFNSLLFGTDWPMCNVAKHVELINSLRITQKEKKNIFYKNSQWLFNLNASKNIRRNNI